MPKYLVELKNVDCQLVFDAEDESEAESFARSAFDDKWNGRYLSSIGESTVTEVEDD